MDLPQQADQSLQAPVSEQIRARIQRANRRFHANDNIAAFLAPGDLEALLDEVAEKMQGVLGSLVIDTTNDHNTQGTARRVAKMYLTEVFRGRYSPAPCAVPAATIFARSWGGCGSA
jgi:GTP cyclohydrolase IA